MITGGGKWNGRYGSHKKKMDLQFATKWERIGELHWRKYNDIVLWYIFEYDTMFHYLSYNALEDAVRLSWNWNREFGGKISIATLLVWDNCWTSKSNNYRFKGAGRDCPSLPNLCFMKKFIKKFDWLLGFPMKLIFVIKYNNLCKY